MGAMGTGDTTRDVKLRRVQLTIGLLAGIAALSVGVYNVKQTFFSEKGPGDVSVHVRTDRGQAVQEAAIEIAKAQGGVVSSAATGADGRYAEQQLAPGNYTVKASKSGFQSEVLVFAVEPGRMAELQITLKPSPSPIRSAVEEVGASWIKDLGMRRDASDAPDAASASTPGTP